MCFSGWAGKKFEKEKSIPEHLKALIGMAAFFFSSQFIFQVDKVILCLKII